MSRGTPSSHRLPVHRLPDTTLRGFATRVATFALLAVLGAIPFATTLATGYLADDWFFVHKYSLAPGNLSSLVWPLFSSLAAVPTAFYRPLSFLTLAAQILAGHEPPLLHGVNLALHGLTAATFFFFIRRVGSGSTANALAGALFFAWFPRRVEAVAWLSCRPDLLAAFWSVISVAAFEIRVRTGRASAFAIALGAWWFAICSKESAVVLPVVHLVLARQSGTGRRDLLPFALSLPLFLLLRRMAIGTWIGGYGPEALAVGPGTVLSAIKHATYQFVPPLEGLDSFLRGSAGNLVVVLVMAVVAAGLLAAVCWMRRDPSAAIGVAWTAAGLIPVMTLKVSLTTTFNDRLLYLPALGAAILLVGVLDRLPSRAALAIGLSTCVACGLASTRLSSRWALAGDVNTRTLLALHAMLARVDAPRVCLVAPDSIGGAYLLRNGTREALQVLGAVRPERVALVSTYFLEPSAPWRAPVRIQVAGPGAYELRSTTPDPQIMLGMPDARGLVTYDAERTTDRFGRRSRARLTSLKPAVFWLVAPGHVQMAETP